THICDGCREELPSPLDVNTLHWSYRINELIADGIDQGVLPHLLATRRINAWARGSDADLLGFLPGLSLEPKSEGGPPRIEVDLFAMKAGRIIIGECKRTGAELEDGQAAG